MLEVAHALSLDVEKLAVVSKLIDAQSTVRIGGNFMTLPRRRRR
jgi:hypothetical protein